VIWLRVVRALFAGDHGANEIFAVNKACQGNAQNVKHNKGERNVCKRSMCFADGTFMVFAAVPGSVAPLIIGESLGNDAGATLTQ
jgi:hypothetical protein